jgi:hypothetical protein
VPRIARDPIQVFNLIGQCGAWTLPRNRHLEQIALDLPSSGGKAKDWFWGCEPMDSRPARAGARPAHVPPEDQIETRQYLLLSAYSTPPPQGFLTQGCPKIDFPLQVFRSDASKQLGKVVLLGANKNDNDNDKPSLFANINLIVQMQSSPDYC